MASLPFSRKTAERSTRLPSAPRPPASATLPWPALAITRGDHYFGLTKSLEVSSGGSIRGVATGLAADIYDWRRRNDAHRLPTLQFLRYSRDRQAELWLGANMRGLIEPDPAGGYRYYDTSLSTLARMAADWERYVNHIVPTYRQGDPINDPLDAAILESLT